MPLKLNFIESLVFLKLNRGPGFLLDVFGAGAFQAVSTALKLGVFEALADGHTTAKRIADRLKLNERGTRILLDFLVAYGYVKNEDGRYVNTAMTSKWILQSASTNLADMIKSWERTFEFWRMHLEESVRNGKPATTIYEWFDQNPENWQIFNSFEMAVARWIGGELLAKVRLLPTARKMLDIGGGHGLYSAMFCRRYPQLSSTVLDMPTPLETAQETIVSEGMVDRISLRAGDYWTDDLGAGYDVALLFNIIHAHLPDKNAELLRKVSQALNSNGTIVIIDQLVGGSRSPLLKAIPQFFGLTYLTTLGGQTYSFEELSKWLRSAGFGNPHLVSRAIGLVTAKKASVPK